MTRVACALLASNSMDPATAFSVACGTFQLVTLSLKAIDSGIEVWKSSDSLTTSNQRLDYSARAISNAASSVSASLVTLRAAGPQLTQDRDRLRSVSEDCLRTSSELRDILDSVRTKPEESKRRYKPKQVFRQVRKKGRIKELEALLETAKNTLDTELLVNLL